MFVWPDGTVTGSVNYARLQDIVDRKDDESVTEAGWANLEAFLSERLGVARPSEFDDSDEPNEDPESDEDPEPTKAEIQDALRERGLPTTGNKAELLERLADDMEEVQ